MEALRVCRCLADNQQGLFNCCDKHLVSTTFGAIPEMFRIHKKIYDDRKVRLEPTFLIQGRNVLSLLSVVGFELDQPRQPSSL